MTAPASLTVNGRTYRWMDRPLVVVCVDGCQFEYLTAAVAAGAAPFLGRLLAGAGASSSPTASCRASPTPTISRS